jgi:hypothetical protein
MAFVLNKKEAHNLIRAVFDQRNKSIARSFRISFLKKILAHRPCYQILWFMKYKRKWQFLDERSNLIIPL